MDDAVRRILRLKFRLGLFENPYIRETTEKERFLQPEDIKIAEKLAEESFVLLKNKEKRLPLAADTKVAVIGPLGKNRWNLLGSWTAHGKDGDVVGIYDGQKCWKLESLPKDKRDIYSRKTALIRQDCLIPVRVEYYDKMGKLHRRLEMSDIAKVEGFWVARKMHMTNVQTEHQTVLEIKNPTYNIPMEESKFNVTTLEKGRF